VGSRALSSEEYQTVNPYQKTSSHLRGSQDSNLFIYDDVRVAEICAAMTDEEGALKRPDLMYETFITKKGKTRKVFNMTEITSPWSWKNSLDNAYEKKVRKYQPVAMMFHDRNKDVYDEVRLNIIVVSPSGVFPMRSQKDFAIATGLKRGDLAAHAKKEAS
jgi:hypothetical protein